MNKTSPDVIELILIITKISQHLQNLLSWTTIFIIQT